jgi:chaperone modulatory protein CbpM
MSPTAFNVTIVEEELQLSLLELCRATRAPEEQIRTWVVEGVLEPVGTSPQEWRFAGASLRRARLALTLTQELEINPPGVALALDLLEQIAALRAQQRGSGGA